MWQVARRGSTSSSPTSSLKVDRHMVCTGGGPGGLFVSLPKDIKEHTVVKVRRGIGVARFIGPLEDKPGTFVGVELFSPTGLNDGTRKGFFYFEAKMKHGIFVRYPGGVLEEFGPITDKGTLLIDDIFIPASRILGVSELAKERTVKTIIALIDCKDLFCSAKLEILGIILFYDLLMF